MAYFCCILICFLAFFHVRLVCGAFASQHNSPVRGFCSGSLHRWGIWSCIASLCGALPGFIHLLMFFFPPWTNPPVCNLHDATCVFNWSISQGYFISSSFVFFCWTSDWISDLSKGRHERLHQGEGRGFSWCPSCPINPIRLQLRAASAGGFGAADIRSHGRVARGQRCGKGGGDGGDGGARATLGVRLGGLRCG